MMKVIPVPVPDPPAMMEVRPRRTFFPRSTSAGKCLTKFMHGVKQ